MNEAGCPMSILSPVSRRWLPATVACLAVAAWPGSGAAERWQPPADYAFRPPAVCVTDPAGAGRATRPTHATYRVCDDQMAIFRQGLADARLQGKLVLVSFGATWCPWCTTMQRHMAGQSLLGADSGKLAASLHPIEIALSTLDKGQKADVPSGEAVLALVTARTPSVKVRTIPFVVVIDPSNETRVFARNLDDVATRSGDFDLPRLRAVLDEGVALVRTGAPAAVEPGWLRRKWLRLWNG